MAIVEAGQHNGATHGGARLVPVRIWLDGGLAAAKRQSVQGRVLGKLVEGAVQLVGAAFRNEADRAPGKTSVFGRQYARLHVYFLHRIDDGGISARIVADIVFGQDVGHAVDELLVVAI